MTDTPPDDRSDELADKYQRLGTPHTSSTWKVLGEIDARTGAGVLGHNTATTGESRGVIGVTDSPDGYGLATPDDARIQGVLDTSGTDFVVEAGTTATGDARNVVAGHASNAVRGGAVGATIGGGGLDDGSTVRPNEVFDNYGTVAGGEANVAGNDDGDPTTATHATVGGGQQNTASGESATVGGGEFNTATSGSSYATISGGTSNAVTAFEATVGGGQRNTACGPRATVGGGINNVAGGGISTVGGGQRNTATAPFATVGGGVRNTASDDSATVGGGEVNTASAEKAIVGGGRNNLASGRMSVVGGGGDNKTHGSFSTVVGGGDNRTGKSGAFKGLYATVPGGLDNLAREDFSFAAGRQAKATNEGAFVWADATSGSVTSTTRNSFIVEATGGVGIGTDAPDAPVEVRSKNSWNLDTSEGDLKIGDNGYRFTLGIATGGVGAGTVNMRAKGGDKKLRLGSGGSNIVTVQEPDGVYPTADDSYKLGRSGNRWQEVWVVDGTVNTSDARLKDGITTVDDGLDRVCDLRPVSFEWADRPASDRHLGLLAQEVADAVPEAVVEPSDGYLGVNYETLVPVLIDAVQTQQDDLAATEGRIADLEAENEQLRERNAELEARVAAIETHLDLEGANDRPASADG